MPAVSLEFPCNSPSGFNIFLECVLYQDSFILMKIMEIMMAVLNKIF